MKVTTPELRLYGDDSGFASEGDIYWFCEDVLRRHFHIPRNGSIWLEIWDEQPGVDAHQVRCVRSGPGEPEYASEKGCFRISRQTAAVLRREFGSLPMTAWFRVLVEGRE